MNTQTAYQRWELASLHDEDNHDFRTMPPAIARLAQQMMESRDHAVQQGYQEGYNDGLQQGLSHGEAKALSEGREEQSQIAAQLQHVLEQYRIDLLRAREQIAEDLLKLSLDMAQAIVRQSIDLQPGLMLPAIEQALLDIPSLQLPATIHVHPEDFDLLEQSLGPSLKADGWRLISDHSVESGGCLLNTPSQDIDLQLSTRWQRLYQHMGLQSGGPDSENA